MHASSRTWICHTYLENKSTHPSNVVCPDRNSVYLQAARELPLSRLSRDGLQECRLARPARLVESQQAGRSAAVLLPDVQEHRRSTSTGALQVKGRGSGALMGRDPHDSRHLARAEHAGQAFEDGLCARHPAEGTRLGHGPVTLAVARQPNLGIAAPERGTEAQVVEGDARQL
jgi:hypothetical protein